MPQVQMIDTTPKQSQQATPLETALDAFAKRTRQNKDTDILGDIYRRNESNLDNALKEVQTAPGLSPSARINNFDQIMNLKRTNTEIQKDINSHVARANTQAEKLEKEKQKQKEKDAALKAKTTKEDLERKNVEDSVYELYKDVLPEDEARRRSKFDSPAVALKETDRLHKAKIKEEEKKEDFRDISSTLQELYKTLKKGKVGVANSLNITTPSGREARAYFDELSLGVEKRLAQMVGKGSLQKVRFDLIKKNLPSSNSTDASNLGKLKGLAKEFGVDLDTGNESDKEAFADLPSAAEFKGKTLRNPETGERVRSDGVSWSKI